MGMRINREGAGYLIRLTGDRSKFIARTPKEITTAVEHYYGLNGHSNGINTDCPLCRHIAERMGCLHAAL